MCTGIAQSAIDDRLYDICVLCLIISEILLERFAVKIGFRIAIKQLSYNT